MNYRNTRLIYAAVISIFLASCASVEHKPPEDTRPDGSIVAADDPSSLIEKGLLTEAAMAYLASANQKQAPEKQQIQLKAINLLIDAEHFSIAHNLLNEMTSSELTETQLVFFAYLNARLEINNRNAELSLQWLDLVQFQDYTSFATEMDILRLLINAHNLAGDIKSATLERIKLDKYLTDDEAKQLTNQQAIIRGFISYSAIQLQELADNQEPGIVKDWIALSLLIKNSKNPFRLGNMLKSWKILHPEHPVSDPLLAILAPQEEDEPTAIENIALLLPMTGSFDRAAQAVRDGFLASFYAADTPEIRPTIRIYDTGGDINNILTTYQQATNDGANVIIGPLRKEAVEMLAHGTNHSVPTLALNQIENSDFYSNNFYQFPLSPEAEAQQIAQKAWQDGLSHASIITPDSKWGERVTEAFRVEWEALGGKVVSEAIYNARENDFSIPIKSLLAIDKSNARKRELSKIIGAPLTFEPRRRQDIDFVFMAAFPRQARLIPSQLSFHHASKLPIYTTSHSFSGHVDRKKDRDLNKVIVGDMPWTINMNQSDSLKLQIQRLWPNETIQFNRLYALGVDSYNILFYLNWLRANSNSRIQGATGELSMSETNLIMRQLSWAKFRNGGPVMLPNTGHLTSNQSE